MKQFIESHIAVANAMFDLLPTIEQIGQLCVEALQKGNKVIFAGNGGSAADSQHLAAELVGRYVRERISLPALALTTDTSALTAIGNDYGYDAVFARQLSGVGQSGDVFIGISTSGNSPNVLKALEVAKAKNITTVGFLGRDGGAMREKVDVALVIPSMVTARIQEMHILAGHLICEYIDEAYGG